VMVGERRNGNLLVHLGPTLQAHPEELIRQRRGHDGHTEYLIRWSILSLEEGPGSSTNASSAESKAENILMWMSAEEVYANCPTLLGKRKPEGQRVKEEKAPSTFPPDVTLDEASLLEMKADVRNLVQRASRQMAGPTGPESSILNTIHVLSAYASIGSLTGVFKETGALDLLMKKLWKEEKQIRRSAGKMLRALASHDAGEISWAGAPEKGWARPSSNKLVQSEILSHPSPAAAPRELSPGKWTRSCRHSQPVAVFLSLSRSSVTPPAKRRRQLALVGGQGLVLCSLIWPGYSNSTKQPKAPACAAVQVPLVTPKPSPRKKQGPGFLTLSDFARRSSYVEYVQESLKPGMMVRMMEDYEEISAGDEGEFRQSNNGMPPVQVLWQSTGRTYWVHWHMVEIIGAGEQPEETAAQEKVSSLTENLTLTTVTQTFYCKPLGGLYSLPYLTERLSEDSEALSRAEWWELLFFVKKLDPHEQQEIAQLIRQHQEEQVWDGVVQGREKDLGGIGNWEVRDTMERSGRTGERGDGSGWGEKPYPLNHADAPMMWEIFASIGSASSKDSDSLLCALPAAIRTMQGTAGASSAVQNGLLVAGLLIDSHRGLAEQLVSCDIHSALQSCCQGGQDPTAPSHATETLAQIALSRLAEHQLPTNLDTAGTEPPHPTPATASASGRAAPRPGSLRVTALSPQVIDACQKWESGPALKFLSFCCSSTDVLSCTLHLLSQGYVRRQEDNPQLLEYVSTEPTTPHRGQAQVIFRSTECLRGQDKGSKFSPLDAHGVGPEAVLMETLLLPMGRTMSQEEVQVLMNQTVKQVLDTLSVSADRAQHLLIHCKWNVDLLIERYTEDPELLLISSGLQVQNPQPPPSPVTHCPVCVSQLCTDDSPPTLCCMHYCCKFCWNKYLTTCIEQNLVQNCTCPIPDCPAQPTTDFIRSIISSPEVIAKYEKALLRGYVECCSNLTWCTNPQGCDQVLCKEGLGCGEACSKCCWISCFNCNFPEAHYPASCSHMSQWMDDGGYYEGMTVEAQSKHLAKLISKRCPSCQAQIEKNEGCLHMTCAKCNHGFCWRCLKPWKPTHKDYYNCSAMVSKAARQEKRFQDYNERCTFHHQAREFAMNLRNRVSAISEVPQIRTLTFVVDACKVLEQARKVLAYSAVYSYYNQDTEKMDVMEQQTENLELHTNALQILLEETLLQCQDLASSIRLFKAEHFNTGLELVRRIQERLLAILQHSTQVPAVCIPRLGQETLGVRPLSSLLLRRLKFDGASDSPDTDEGAKEEEEEEDEEYVPEWQEEYDDEDLDDDNFSYDDESENLERDSFFFDDEDEAYD
uniref:Cullin 9 n=1 Tax=Chrysemys picta bellii TaxID=8478 RepID=A0A8C3F2W5_CHRPI